MKPGDIGVSEVGLEILREDGDFVHGGLGGVCGVSVKFFWWGGVCLLTGGGLCLEFFYGLRLSVLVGLFGFSPLEVLFGGGVGFSFVGGISWGFVLVLVFPFLGLLAGLVSAFF